MTTTTFPALTDAEGKLAAKQKALADIFGEAGPDMDMSKVKSLSGDSKAKVDAIRTMNAELEPLADKVKELKDLFGIAERVRDDHDTGHAEKGAENGGPTRRDKHETKSFGQLFVESKAIKERNGKIGPEATIDIELKSLFQTAAGWAPETFRTGKLVEFATRPIQVTDLIPQTTTVQAAIVYMEETGFTNNAAETAEGGQFPESSLVLTEQTSNVRKISTYLPVTDEQLEDVTQVMGYVDNRLRFMLRQRLDGQILVGNGTAPNLRGFLNVAGIQTQAKGADPTPDAVYKAMVKIMVTGRANPDAVIFHPTNWQDVRLLRTADGIYIWGSPSDSAPNRIWGLPVALADSITLGSALVLDTTYTELSSRRGIDVQVSNSHADFFINGKQAVRADTRVALVTYRPAALSTVTGL